jgi:hypothetical protein
MEPESTARAAESSDRLFTPPARERVNGHVADRMIHGAVRGAVASMAMTGAREFTRNAGLLEEPPPESIFRKLTRRRLSGVKHGPSRAAVELAHWGYGAAAGAAFAALPAPLRRASWSGPLFGLLVWTSFEVGIAPLLGLSQARRIRALDRAALAVDHLLYGYMLSEGATQRSDPARR